MPEKTSNSKLKIHDIQPTDERVTSRGELALFQRHLKVIARPDFKFGVKKVAGLLAGSKPKKPKEQKLTEHPEYGALSDLSPKEIETFINQLLQNGLLQKQDISDNKYAYYLDVTDKGKDKLTG
jgi:superfamily II DNA helicase RecQ